jgi:hypothetical protein
MFTGAMKQVAQLHFILFHPARGVILMTEIR